MKIEINGQLVGVYQENNNFFARVSTRIEGGFHEVDFPITAEQFHKLNLTNVKLTLETL